MLSQDSIAFLKTLLDTPGPSGFEAAPARLWRERARTFAEVRGDVAGNSIATVNPRGTPTIMLAGHIDEIGLIITYVDDDGYSYFARSGNGTPRCWSASASGSWRGVATSSASSVRSRSTS